MSEADRKKANEEERKKRQAAQDKASQKLKEEAEAAAIAAVSLPKRCQLFCYFRRRCMLNSNIQKHCCVSHVCFHSKLIGTLRLRGKPSEKPLLLKSVVRLRNRLQISFVKKRKNGRPSKRRSRSNVEVLPLSQRQSPNQSPCSLSSNQQPLSRLQLQFAPLLLKKLHLLRRAHLSLFSHLLLLSLHQ